VGPQPEATPDSRFASRPRLYIKGWIKDRDVAAARIGILGSSVGDEEPPLRRACIHARDKPRDSGLQGRVS